MLNELLELLRAGGTRRVSDLAQELDTTPELIELMLDDLARMGYLSKVEQGCHGRCASCPMEGVCTIASKSEIWTLKESPS